MGRRLLLAPLGSHAPLWEAVLIGGLDGGRWALAHKTHHCLVDGVGSVDVAQLLLDIEPTGSAATAVSSAPTPPGCARRPELRTPRRGSASPGARRPGRRGRYARRRDGRERGAAPARDAG